VNDELVIENRMYSSTKRGSGGVVDLRTPAAIRMQAAHLRRTLLSRNTGPTFANVLAALGDDELVQMDASHHNWKVAYVAQRVEVRTELIVTPEMREAAWKQSARRGTSAWS
jgi:hypothetical protein